MARSNSSEADYQMLIGGVYSKKSASPVTKMSKGSKNTTGTNNPLKLTPKGLLGKQSGIGSGKNKIADNPLGISGGMFKGKGKGTGAKTPNFSNNPHGYKSGLLVGRKGGK